MEKYFDIPGNVEEDKADEDREADDAWEGHAGKAEYEQDERSQNHQRKLPVLHEPETNL